MRVKTRRQSGVMLALVMVVMALLSGLLAALATCTAGFHRERQIERVQRVARVVTNSAVSYAREHLRAWENAPPNQPIDLDLTALLPHRTNGSAQITFDTTGNTRQYHVAVRVERHGISAIETINLEMNQRFNPPGDPRP